MKQWQRRDLSPAISFKRVSKPHLEAMAKSMRCLAICFLLEPKVSWAHLAGAATRVEAKICVACLREELEGGKQTRRGPQKMVKDA